jgi:hypothetical protein
MSFFNSRNSREGAKIDYEQVAKMAYLKWEAAGRPEGRDKEFWHRAETEYARTHGLWDWNSGPFKVGNDYYIETVEGIREKLPPGTETAIAPEHFYPAPWRSAAVERSTDGSLKTVSSS